MFVICLILLFQLNLMHKHTLLENKNISFAFFFEQALVMENSNICRTNEFVLHYGLPHTDEH